MNPNPVLAYEQFFKTFYSTFNLNCPVETKKLKDKLNMPINPWMTSGLLKADLLM